MLLLSTGVELSSSESSKFSETVPLENAVEVGDPPQHKDLSFTRWSDTKVLADHSHPVEEVGRVINSEGNEKATEEEAENEDNVYTVPKPHVKIPPHVFHPPHPTNIVAKMRKPEAVADVMSMQQSDRIRSAAKQLIRAGGTHSLAHGPHDHVYGRRHFGMPFGGGPPGADKLYARFVCVATVFDGTEMAPGTHFVKIWRLRNSGTSPWPANTCLELVGGDGLGHAASIPLEIPALGLDPAAEMEAAVSMIAPEKPGRYVSHWELVSPTGSKFGDRLSVVIQVVPKTNLDCVPAELVVVGDGAPAVEAESAGATTSQTPAAELADERDDVHL